MATLGHSQLQKVMSYEVLNPQIFILFSYLKWLRMSSLYILLFFLNVFSPLPLFFAYTILFFTICYFFRVIILCRLLYTMTYFDILAYDFMRFHTFTNLYRRTINNKYIIGKKKTFNLTICIFSFLLVNYVFWAA